MVYPQVLHTVEWACALQELETAEYKHCKLRTFLPLHIPGACRAITIFAPRAARTKHCRYRRLHLLEQLLWHVCHSPVHK